MAIQKDTITIENPWGGWASDPITSSNSASVPGLLGEFGKGTALTLVNPGFMGCLSPGPAFAAITDAGGRVTAKPVNGAIVATGEVFSVLRNARVVRFGIGDDTIDNNYDVTAHGGHSLAATSDNLDLLSYTTTAGVDRILWTWEDSSDADIAMIVGDGTGQDDDFFSTRTGSAVLTKSVPLKLWQGPNGKIYCTNGRYIASYDAITDTGNTQALDVDYGFITSSGCPYGIYSAIVGYKRSLYTAGFGKAESRMWLWNGRDPSFQLSYIIPDNFVTKVENRAGQLLVWTQGDNNSTKLWKFNGQAEDSFDLLVERKDIGNAPIHGGTDAWFNHIIWGTDAGNLYLFGSPNKKKYPEGFSSYSSLQNIGMVKQFSGGNLYVGNTSGSTHTIQKVNTAQYVIGTNFRSILYAFPPRSTVTSIRIYLAQFGAGASLQIGFFKDYNTLAFGGAADLANTTITNTADGALSYYAIKKTITDVNSAYLGLNFNHAAATNTVAVVRKVAIDYEYDTDMI